MLERKGLILAGGTGSRLTPITWGVSKQLLPVFDKPMIYYPISVLMMCGIRDIAIITTQEDQYQFERLLGDGSQWNVQFTWIVQNSPDGLAQAYLLAEEFLSGMPSTMVLGDNIFYGQGLPELLKNAANQDRGGVVFSYHVSDPERYGVIDLDEQGNLRGIVEKPAIAPSNYAVTGLYFLDGRAPEMAAKLRPSERGELEITDLLELYRIEGSLRVERMRRGFAWFDIGTHNSFMDASNFVRSLEMRQGLQVGCPEEIAFNNGWIDENILSKIAENFGKNEYRDYLFSLLK